MENFSTRRALLGSTIGAAAALSAAPALAKKSGGYQPAPVKDGVSTLSPDEALDLLKSGNRAFVADRSSLADVGARRRLELAKYQAPFCAYVSCSDSRVPPEILFGRGLGELFIVRNAGNTIDTTAQGSIEFAVSALKTPLIVVMGHEACGAVKAAISVVESNARYPGSIGKMIEPIVPAVLEARGQAGDAAENAIRQNVRRTVRSLREDANPLILDPLRAGKLRIVGAYYHFDTGVVDFFDAAA